VKSGKSAKSKTSSARPQQKKPKSMESLSEVPTVYCPKEKKNVPIWVCLGSFMQQKETCSHLIEAKVSLAKKQARVKCGWKE